MMGKEFTNLTEEDLCDLMCGGPEEEERMTEKEFQKQLRDYRKTQIMPVELAVKLLTECGLECMYEDETRNALDMAIKALSAEPCEDCVSRHEVMCAIGSTSLHYELARKLRKLPPVTPKQKSGRWILQPSNTEQDERDFIWWKCSECGQVIYSETEQDRREYHAFCGRCGAKMRETVRKKCR